MSIEKNKILAGILLVSLIFTCVGGSVGMLLHQNHAVAFSDISAMEAEHGCCGMAMAEAGNEAGSMASVAADHHIADATLVQLVILLLIIVGINIFPIVKLLLILVATRIEEYVYSIQRRYGTFQYFRLHIIRLFSKGILHTQVW